MLDVFEDVNEGIYRRSADREELTGAGGTAGAAGAGRVVVKHGQRVCGRLEIRGRQLLRTGVENMECFLCSSTRLPVNSSPPLVSPTPVSPVCPPPVSPPVSPPPACPPPLYLPLVCPPPVSPSVSPPPACPPQLYRLLVCPPPVFTLHIQQV